MRIHIRKFQCFHILIMFTVFFLWTGCGKKAPPAAPKHYVPPVVEDLSYDLEGDMLNLTWTIPQGQKKATGEPASCIVYRSKISLTDSDCRRCPAEFDPVAEILTGLGGSGKVVQKKMTYREKLEKNYQYTYKVILYTTNGLSGKDSNYVYFIYE